MSSRRASIELIFTAIFYLFSINSAKADDFSALRMSFADAKVAVSQAENPANRPTETPTTPPTGDQTTPNPLAEGTTTPPPETPATPQPQPNNRANRNRPEHGWYFGIERGTNNANMSATLPNGARATWNSNNSLGGLFDLSNFNGFAGYRSSNFRLEGEVMVGNTAMTIDRNNTTTAILGSPDPNNSGSPAPASTAVPPNCTATNLAAMLNGYYDFDRLDRFKPFVGIGLGYSTTLLRDGTVQWGSQAGFTYQVKAGVGYDIGDGQEVYLQYKYLNLPAQYVNQSGQLFNTALNSNNFEIGTRIKF